MTDDASHEGPRAGGSVVSRVWSIASGRPFLDTLAAAILDGHLPEPSGTPPDQLTLAGMTVVLPTHRAVRAMQDAFLRAAKGRALLLPRLVPIAETDENLGLLAGLADGGGALAAEFSLPPAISPLERHLVLTRLVLAWSRQMRGGIEDDGSPVVSAGATTPAQAAHLATDLARLIDMVETEGRSLDGLAHLVPADYSAHWEQTIRFLRIVTEFWPDHLSERGLLSPADRRNRLILAEAERLSRSRPSAPVIVAGVTGSVPATIALMRAVAALPAGAIVVSGLDLALDDESWQRLDHHPEHPQHGLARLLSELGVPRAAIGEVGGAADAVATVRSGFLSEVMRPAGATERWAAYVANADREALRTALAGIARIDAPTSADEAETIALMMRAALETPGLTAALVSPDRLLARRVEIRLARWGIRIDDSAGRPLAKTPHGAFLDLIASAVTSRFAPAAVMALLKHPLTRLGRPIRDVRRAARILELAALRTVYLGEGLDGLERNLARAARETLAGSRRERAVRRLWDADWAAARDLVARLRDAVTPLAMLAERGARCPLQTFAAAHRAVAEAIALEAEGEGPKRLWQDEDGEEAERLLDSLDDAALPAPDLAPADYADFYRTLAAGVTVRPRVAVHPRLSIWGPYEARLQQPDLVILGSLNEGTWPAAADPGAWLNRPMRAALGLPAPEAEIGRAALDVTGLFGAREVVLTRARRVDGAPTVPSRWLMRIDALLGGMGLSDVLKPSKPWLGWARARDSIDGAPRPVRAPEPRPALRLRPRRLSVSAIEQWIKNPYGLYARHILGLEPLAMLGAAPGPREKGMIVHDALSRFAERFPHALPDNIAAELMRDAEETLADYAANARVRAFWRPRIARFADWFAATEARRRENTTGLLTEVEGNVVLPAPAGPFTLRARADRIDILSDGIVITDYKTGAPPKEKQVTDGVAPQLPLEAAIARAGGFAGVEARAVTGLRYIRAGGGDPAGQEQAIGANNVHALAEFYIGELNRLIAYYDDDARPYKAVRRARFSYTYDDFAHLARVAEWTGEENGDDDEAEA